MCIKITQCGHCVSAKIFQYAETTNNFCEAQFLVIKDDILKRQKKVNIVALLDKLTNELDHHYKNKLLSISTGKNLFSTIHCTGKGGHRFSSPETEEQEKICTLLVNRIFSRFQRFARHL